MALSKEQKLSNLRHKYVRMMLTLVKSDKVHYDQSAFPGPTENNPEVCSTTFCAAGFLALAKSQRLFDRLCKQTVKEKAQSSTVLGYTPNLWDIWGKAGMDILQIKDNTKGDEEASTLFGMYYSWPQPFAKQYRLATTPTQRYQALYNRWIDWLNKSDVALGLEVKQ